ncbi:hypothetical protein HKCCE3408_00050 [Rhodobacterales bacterium HKCCE3408]|nr:hypothetical protein [Rhodobacterales bacterium HKCCE3408]
MGIFESNAIEAQKRAARKDYAGALLAIDRAAAEARKALLLRARLLAALGRDDEALDELVRLDRPGVPVEFLEFRADLETRLDRVDDAIATLDRAIDAARDPATFLARRGDMHRARGEFDAAVADFDAALNLRPTDGELHRLRGELVRARPDDGMIETLRAARAAVPDDSRSAVHLDFALARALDQVGDHEASAEALLKANAGMRALFPYDIARRHAQVDAVRKAFADVTPAKMPTAGTTDFAPIFVTGMPRSGTTLIEQILSAHPDVAGAGETGLFSAAATEILGAPDAPPPGGLRLTPEKLTEVGQRYRDRMRARVPDATRVTDKSIQTLLFAGPALVALPRAHVVVVRRDPRATALSLFRQVFRDGKQLFSYDLSDIRDYQMTTDDLVAFWSERLSDRFHVVDYEAFVTAPERAIRDLLDRVGLPFDPACLAPEDNDRPVRTLSAVAVRRPINTGALDVWKPYATLLGLDAPAD